MRISDWSSDVGSSDLGKHTAGARSIAVPAGIAWQASSPRPLPAILASLNNRFLPPRPAWRTIGACLHRQVAMQTAPGYPAPLLVFASVRERRPVKCLRRRPDRKSVGWGKRGAVRVGFGG